ncbi:MAG: nucleotide exchange factor GrpE [Verrucomicrobia bacterium]|jgi:molecular chaperone GrpE|nr:nucleotide exchange factor GrpE [Verrucomicrobiota bacterium]
MRKPNTERDSTPTAEPEAPPEPGSSTAPGKADATNGAQPALPTDAELAELKAQAAKAQEHWDRLLRVTADFDNFRKRAAREKEEAIRYANHKLLERLLPVLDSFDMAIAAADAHNQESQQSLKDGVQLVLQQFRTVLTEAGLEEIQAHGKPFDPNLHEAISQVETEEFEEGHVAQQVRKGYLLRDRLVRPSSVIVAKRPAA